MKEQTEICDNIYFSFSFLVTSLMIAAIALGYEKTFIFLQILYVCFYVYLLFAGRMLPNAKAFYYDLIYTRYDRKKRNAYVSELWARDTRLIEGKYNSSLIFLSGFFVANACLIFDRVWLVWVSVTGLTVAQLAHFLTAYLSVRKEMADVDNRATATHE